MRFDKENDQGATLIENAILLLIAVTLLFSLQFIGWIITYQFELAGAGVISSETYQAMVERRGGGTVETTTTSAADGGDNWVNPPS